jgi:pantoate--beta-alanine ligase
VKLITDLNELSNTLEGNQTPGSSVGLVPTMGYLHAGHARLLERAGAENSLVFLSIFVNPSQFAPTEDLDKYPRNLEGDLELARQLGVDLVFAPSAAQMYPAGFASSVVAKGVALPLEGERRPGHFAGVCTVVLKLFNLLHPTRAYFGEKDWQQLQVVRQMVRDLHLGVQIVACPTEREASGLARSSRNSYMSESQRQQANIVYRALQQTRAAFAAGERDAERLLEAGLAVLRLDSEVQLEYFSLVNELLAPLQGTVQEPEKARLLLTARMFGVRLIDNMPLV